MPGTTANAYREITKWMKDITLKVSIAEGHCAQGPSLNYESI